MTLTVLGERDVREAIFYKAYKLLYQDIFEWLSTSDDLVEDFLDNCLKTLEERSTEIASFGGRTGLLGKFIRNLSEQESVFGNFNTLFSFATQMRARHGRIIGQEFVMKYVEGAWRSNLQTLSSKNLELAGEVKMQHTNAVINCMLLFIVSVCPKPYHYTTNVNPCKE